MKRKLIKAINLFCFFIYNRIISIFLDLDANRFVFLSEAREQLGGNLKLVYDGLEDVKYTKKVHVKGDRRKVASLKETIDIWKDLTTSKYIVLDDFYGLISAARVRKGQEIIQLWHGAGAYKKFGFSRNHIAGKLPKVHSGYKKYTKAIVSSEHIRSCYSEAFGIDISKVYATGIPRTDELLNEILKTQNRKQFYEQNPKLVNKKIVLFAPTYRGSKVEDADYDFEYANLDYLQEELGDGYNVITRWHPALNNNISNGKVSIEKCKNVSDFSAYEDINTLLEVTDILVTDYSSIIFDYFLLNKPIIFFTPDQKEYANERGLYFGFEEYTYGECVEDRTKLKDAIVTGDMKEERRKAFNKKFMEECRGKSTQNVIELILRG